MSSSVKSPAGQRCREHLILLVVTTVARGNFTANEPAAALLELSAHTTTAHTHWMTRERDRYGSNEIATDDSPADCHQRRPNNDLGTAE